MGANDGKKALKKLKVLNFGHKTVLKPYRKKIEETFCVPFLPNNVDRKEMVIGGVACDLLKPEIAPKKRVILYVHGGNFVAGSRCSWRNLCASICNESSSRLVLPEYRLAPEHPFPAALEDIEAVYAFLTSRHCDVVLAGDGAGAGIALSLVHKLLASSKPVPKALVLISPWADLSPSSPLFSVKKISDRVMTSDNFFAAAELYTYTSNRGHPFVSPLRQSFAGFPPVFIQAAEEELLMTDVRRIVQAAEEAGVACTADVWPSVWHLFQMADEYTPYARLAVEKIGRYIKTCS